MGNGKCVPRCIRCARAPQGGRRRGEKNTATNARTRRLVPLLLRLLLCFLLFFSFSFFLQSCSFVPFFSRPSSSPKQPPLRLGLARHLHPARAMASLQRDRNNASRHDSPDNEHHQHQDLDSDNAWADRTPSYTDIHETANGAAVHVSSPPPPAMPVAALQVHQGLPPPPPATGQSQPAQTLTQSKQPHLLPLPAPVSTPSGLCARLELETDTVEIYDRSNDSFQYSLKGTIELEWTSQTELILKDARIDFMGYAVR